MLQDLLVIIPTFYHDWCCAQRSFLQVSKISDYSTLQNLPLKFVTSLTLRFKTFSSLSRHRGCCVVRSSVDLCLHSTLIDAMPMLLDFLFAFLPFYRHQCFVWDFLSISKHHWCYASRSSLQRSNIIDATLADIFLNILTWMLRTKIFFSIFQHHWPLARQSFFHFLQYNHWCYALSSIFIYDWWSSLVFSNAKVFSCIF